MSTQLYTLWGRDCIGRPNNFSMFLEAILAYSSHPSLTLAHSANPLWNSMLKNEYITRDPVFLSYVPQWVQCTAPKIIKFNYPVGKSPTVGAMSESTLYAKIDFDSEEEFSAYFYRCRSDMLESFR